MTTKKQTKTEVAPGVELSRNEVQDAREEGALDAFRDSGKTAVLVDTGATGDAEAQAEAERFRVASDIQSTVIAPLLGLPLDTLVRRLSNDKVEGHIDFETAKGLLHLERSGKNRTDYVKALMNRIGVDDPRDVTTAGPSYTNDVTNITHLGDR